MELNFSVIALLCNPMNFISCISTYDPAKGSAAAVGSARAYPRTRPCAPAGFPLPVSAPWPENTASRQLCPAALPVPTLGRLDVPGQSCPAQVCDDPNVPLQWKDVERWPCALVLQRRPRSQLQCLLCPPFLRRFFGAFSAPPTPSWHSGSASGRTQTESRNRCVTGPKQREARAWDAL